MKGTKMEKESLEEAPVRNNATLVPMGGLVPIESYEVWNEELQIWKGKLVIPPGSGAPDIVYFSRKYQPEINELDQIFVEIEILSTELIGVPFIMVPKEKFMFGYFKGSDKLILPKKNIKLPPHRQ